MAATTPADRAKGYGQRESAAEAPSRFRGDVSGVRLTTRGTQELIEAKCGKSSKPGKFRAACVLDWPLRTEVVIPNPCHPQFAGENLAWRLCHELGHVNGWTGDHEP